MGLWHNGSGTEANLSRRAILLPRAVRCHFATYFKMLLPRAVCRVPLFWTAAERKRNGSKSFTESYFASQGRLPSFTESPRVPGVPAPVLAPQPGPGAVTGTRTPTAHRARSCTQSALEMIFSPRALKGLRVHPWACAFCLLTFRLHNGSIADG